MPHEDSGSGQRFVSVAPPFFEMMQRSAQGSAKRNSAAGLVDTLAQVGLSRPIVYEARVLFPRRPRCNPVFWKAGPDAAWRVPRQPYDTFVHLSSKSAPSFTVCAEFHGLIHCFREIWNAALLTVGKPHKRSGRVAENERNLKRGALSRGEATPVEPKKILTWLVQLVPLPTAVSVTKSARPKRLPSSRTHHQHVSERPREVHFV